MVNYKRIATDTKLSKNDEVSCIDSTLYKRLVRSLMYLIGTRLDIMFVVSMILDLWRLQRVLIGKQEK